MLELSEKNIKAGIIKMFQQSTTDYLRKNFKIENLSKSRKAYLKKKKKENGKYKAEKNNLKKNLAGEAQNQSGDDRSTQ